MRSAERTPQRRRRAHPRGAARHHVVDAVADVDRGGRLRAEQRQGLLDRLGMRLGVGHLVGTHQHVHHRLEPGQREPAQGARAVLAGHEAGGTAGVNLLNNR